MKKLNEAQDESTKNVRLAKPQISLKKQVWYLCIPFFSIIVFYVFSVINYQRRKKKGSFDLFGFLILNLLAMFVASLPMIIFVQAMNFGEAVTNVWEEKLAEMIGMILMSVLWAALVSAGFGLVQKIYLKVGWNSEIKKEL